MNKVRLCSSRKYPYPHGWDWKFGGMGGGGSKGLGISEGGRGDCCNEFFFPDWSQFSCSCT